MNEHLQLVREFHSAYSIPQAEFGQPEPLADMRIIAREALLMEEGSELFNAFKRGEMADILAGLVNLGYAALTGVALQGADVEEADASRKHDRLVIAIVRSLSDKINQCSSGKSTDYSALYRMCEQLARDFLNADFDKGFRVVHDSRMAALEEHPHPSRHFKTPDLSDCLFE
ncbi:nucleoside triphosphate pyrophosphohydrolase family protein [Methylomarinum sp. Ch1-1]|uniref:Nucleoside triphosphate pyrophosphohydrolase family protein n=1 Tax=Methylomarinum roseum TaxID=3067653 RepID=A0AAU7NX00_9GAMM|nr:nucleoside triphosphate pyrophosphohydrolase family protein [Methylomarinum sp. Ch1-1]MDP4522394.1 nucleoside triphosphate pyrophosphohydrolase family protein [Methylomarinum sp. Ch1-1]